MINKNPTLKTQEKVLAVLKESNGLMTITEISRVSNKSLYQVKACLEFFEKLGLIELIVSTGKTTIVKMKITKNATTNSS